MADPAAGSCQALVDEVVSDDYEEACHWALGLSELYAGDPPLSAARCVATALGLERPSDDTVSGDAYRVTYAVMCESQGDAMPQYCEIADVLGCEG